MLPWFTAACLVYLAVDGSACDCIYNLHSQHHAAAVQIFRQQACWRASGNKHCARVQVLDLQALVAQYLQRECLSDWSRLDMRRHGRPLSPMHFEQPLGLAS